MIRPVDGIYNSRERHLTANVKVAKVLHCKKRLAIFSSPAGMSLTKLSLAGKMADFLQCRFTPSILQHSGIWRGGR